jgi:ribosomal protein L13E
MMDALRRWFARTEVQLQPRAVSGREVAFAAGYSLLELERAGISEAQAIAAGLTIDRERNSALGSNVMQLERLRQVRSWIIEGPSSGRRGPD